MTAPADDSERGAALVTALGAVRARIAEACATAGRDPQVVTLIAVTKTYPARDVALLARLGVHDIGESRDQELRAKIAELEVGPLAGRAHLRWHFVGRLQTRKARSVATYASAVHSVDRRKLVAALADARAGRNTALDVFIQVSLDDDPQRGGVAVDGIAGLADAVAGHAELRLRGLMAVPPVGADAQEAYARLADLSARLRTEHPDADALSAGMSDDLEAAVRHGSTYVRVGTALLGRRSEVFG